ncbi:MAG: DNA polymerase III subunit [Clostridia bacterium]|nr:DNA polymerase III subunit [Clostridia bacterium]
MADMFPRLYGNGATKRRLGKAVLSNTLAHAFLLDGPDGSGKTTLALSVAAALNCERRGDEHSPLPCGNCINCKRIFDKNYADVHILEKPEDKATFGVEDVRLFRSDVYLSPTESECKVYIIKDAELLTVAAQNALLILLEEPPREVYIFLLSNGVDRILTTIKSRAQYIPMERFSRDDIVRYLKGSSHTSAVDERTLYEIASSSDGVIGRAEELLDPKKRKEIDEARSLTTELIEALRPNAPFSKTVSVMKEMPQKRAELADALQRLTTALRDMLLSKEGASFELLFFPSREALEAASAAFSKKRLLAIYDAVSEAIVANEQNANVSALLSAFAVRVREIKT